MVVLVVVVVVVVVVLVVVPGGSFRQHGENHPRRARKSVQMVPVLKLAMVDGKPVQSLAEEMLEASSVNVQQPVHTRRSPPSQWRKGWHICHSEGRP